jgi:lipopolysaccharide exporter
MSRFVKLVNPKGDLFATGASFVAQGFIKLCSSLILTRLLAPSEYGIIALLMSIVFILLMLSDLGFSLCIVRDENGEQQSYLNTAWTIRIGRAIFHALFILIFAPLIAKLYAAPELTLPLRVLSIWFLIDGLESTSFPVSIRRKQSRIFMYAELVGTAISAVFTVVYCYFSRDYWGMVWGSLVSRLVPVFISHRIYPEIRPRLGWDRAAAKQIFRYTRFVMPSSILTLLTNQYDKAIFLRLFDLRLLGVYSLAGNVAAPIEALITKASRMVLYPRCAHNFRTDPGSFAFKYYMENVKLFAAILAIPAVIGGAARFLITALYDPRYAQAAEVLEAFMVRAALLALASPSEDMLFATGEVSIILTGNVYRAAWMVVASLVGYRYFGFAGFVYGISLSGLPPLVYYLWLQARKGLVIAKYEFYKLAFLCGLAACAYAGDRLMLILAPGLRIKL